MNFVVMMKRKGEREYTMVESYETFEECKEWILEYISDTIDNYWENDETAFCIEEVK